jgi:hypothetical protein
MNLKKICKMIKVLIEFSDHTTIIEPPATDILIQSWLALAVTQARYSIRHVKTYLARISIG